MDVEMGGLSAGRSRRSTAGNRMRELLEQERERLEAKRGNDEDEIFKDEEGDIDFEARAEEGEDIIDSDFDQSSDEGDEGDDELQGEKEIEEEERAAKKASRVKAAPIGVRRQAVPAPRSSQPSTSKSTEGGALSSTTTKRISFALSTAPGDRGMQRSSKRKSTIDASQDVQARLKLEEKRRKEASERAAPKRKKIRLSQADRISEALEMEEQNRESLKKYLELEEERRERDRRRGKKRIDGPWIRIRSVAEDRNAQKRMVQAMQQKQQEAEEVSIAATSGAITLDPVIAAREASKKEREVQSVVAPSEPEKNEPSLTSPKVVEADQVLPITQSEVVDTDLAVDESSVQHSRTTTATDTILTEREDDVQSVVGAKNVHENGTTLQGAESGTDLVPVRQEEYKEGTQEIAVVNPDPEYETRTYVSLHQLSIDTPWQVSWSYVLGTHVDWSHYPFVPARNRPLRPRQSVCPITGLAAQYKDPRSGIAYANKEAYQTLSQVMSGHYLWSGRPLSEADSGKKSYEPMEMGCWLDRIDESGACNVLDRAANKVPVVVEYRVKGTVAPGDEQAIIAAAQALPAGTTRSGGRRAPDSAARQSVSQSTS